MRTEEKSMSDLRIGMIGLDTSHCSAFARNLNREDEPHHVPGGRIVAAVVGGSREFSLSRDRLGKYTHELTKDFGVRLYDSIAEMARNVDAVMLESVDGRQHARQFAELADAGKCVFIDKPLACSFQGARKIAELARAKKVPVMSCSAIRYAAGIDALRDKGEVFSCEAFGPATILDDYPGLFWYGVHSAEVLFSFMSRGCRRVQTVSGNDVNLVVGQWEDGRIGTLRGFRAPGLKQFGCTVVTDSEVHHALVRKDPPYYALMLREIVKFFQTGKSPIDLDETVEIMAFLEAANRSMGESGTLVTIPS